MKNRLILFAFVFILFGIASVSAWSTDLNKNLTNYWRFDENTGNKAYNAIIGSPNITLTASNLWRTGKSSYAVNTAGTTGVDMNSIDYTGSTRGITINFWINRTGTLGAYAGLYYDSDGAALNSNGEFWIRVNGASNKLEVIAQAASTQPAAQAGDDVQQDVWTMVTVTLNNTALAIYYNGTLETAVSANNLVLSNYGDGIFKDTSGNTPVSNAIFDEWGIWNRTLSSSDITELWNSGAGTFYPSSADFTIETTLNSPANNYQTTSPTNVFNATLTPSFSNITNATIYIWNSTGHIVNQTKNTVVGSTANQTIFNISGLPFGNLKWNVLGCVSNGTNGLCSYATSNRTMYNGLTTDTNTWNASTAETASESFVTKLNFTAGLTVSSANLYYGGTSYAGSVSTSGGQYVLSKTMDIPIGNGTKSWFWEVTTDLGGLFNTTTMQQNVSQLNFTLCGSAPFNVPYINFTFKNETVAQESVSASFSSIWTYWLGSGAVNKSYTFLNNTENGFYTFCGNPSSKTIYANPGEITYSNSYSISRSATLGTLTLTNSTTLKTLYLLPTSDGIYVSFQVLDANLQPIQNALVNISHSTYGQIDAKYTDASGLATFFLNPTTSYIISASKSGYPSFSESLTPTQSSYTITLGTTSSTTEIVDTYYGVYLSLLPNMTYIQNETSYTFGINLNSSYYSITLFGITLYGDNNTLIYNQTSTNNGGKLNTTINTGNNSTFLMEYFYTVNGTTNLGRRYFIVEAVSGSGASTNNFVTRLQLYLDNGGLFGLKRGFNLNLLIFFFIFVVTGIFSYKFELSSPASVLAIMTTLVFIFDFALSLVYYPSARTQTIGYGGRGLATFIMFIITIGFAIKEVQT